MPTCTIIYNTGLKPTAQKVFEAQLRLLFKVLKKQLGADALAELSIMLHDDAHLRDLNYQFRGLDKPTNVLSFPNEEYSMDTKSESVGESALSARSAASCDFKEEITEASNSYLGDIAISLETIEREAEEQGKNPLHHLIHMALHGILHLLGYDHENKGDAEEMESLEIKILEAMGIQNPYT